MIFFQNRQLIRHRVCHADHFTHLKLTENQLCDIVPSIRMSQIGYGSSGYLTRFEDYYKSSSDDSDDEEDIKQKDVKPVVNINLHVTTEVRDGNCILGHDRMTRLIMSRF